MMSRFGTDEKLLASLNGRPLVMHAAAAMRYTEARMARISEAMFMSSGIIDHEAGTRELKRLGGLRRAMPVTALLTTLAGAAMAGVPLFNGFLSKEMFFTETLATPVLGGLSWLMPLLATLGGILSVAYSLRLVHAVFFAPASRFSTAASTRPSARRTFPIS